MTNRRFNADRGWGIYPEGIYDTLIKLKNEYGNPRVFIGESGIGRHKGDENDMDENGIVQDDVRIGERSHEENASTNGRRVNCIKYHMWATMNNWSMSNAYKNCYGLIYIDRENNLERQIKKSGFWFKEIVDNNVFSE